ncbi:MAG: hypothetical protein AMK71_07635 [Nitrospira bacterium SG8_35_4]|nr:MAG: hypothetical protein AMK71_07635 [Nitrospira bacterium SG8_35_4]
METPPPLLRRNDSFILLSLTAFLIPVTLFVFRHLDDNKLTGWSWAFAGTDVSVFYFTIVIGLMAAFFLSKVSMMERFPVASLMTLTGITCILFWTEPEVIVDTSRYFTQAKHLSEYGIEYFIRQWGAEINAWTDLPLLPFLYGLIFRFFGENRVYIQCFTALLFSMTAVVTYLTGKTLWDENVGFNAGLLLAGIPYLLTQTPLMLVDTATMFTLIFSVFTFIRAMDKGGIWVPVSAFAVFTAVLSKYSTWMMLSVLGIIFIVHILQNSAYKPHNSKLLTLALYRGLSVFFLAAIPVAIIVFYKFEVFAEQINLLVTFQKPGLKGWSEGFLSTYFFQTHPLIPVAAIFSLYAAVRKRDLRSVIIFWLPLLMILLWIRRSRYILPVFPMLTLMASYGLQSVQDRELRRYAVFAVVSTSLVIAFGVYLPFLKTMSPVNFMHAGRYLNSLNDPVVEVLTPPSESFSINPAVSVPILDLFTAKKIHYRYKELDPPERTKKSPLRFTWAYINPKYYENERGGTLSESRPIVIITAEHGETLPDAIHEKIAGYRKTAEFNATTGVFRFSPDVIIYEP